jgi:ubiquinone/menaquinone biosynthesis C-methylase UbiE
MKYQTSKDSYDAPEGAQNYLKFLESEDGQFFQQILFETFRSRLGGDKHQKILDAACGPGWLTYKLSKEFSNIEALDASGPFLDYARKNYPQCKFTEGNLNNPLPYQDNSFDAIVFSMAAHDVEDQVKTFTELARILKPGGKLMLTFVNPYYAFPVGVWKRGIIGRLLMRMPKLLLRPYHWFAKDSRNFTFHETLECYFYKLSEHLNHLRKAGLEFEFMHELESKQDSPNYNLQYRLHRFPIILYVEFKKK